MKGKKTVVFRQGKLLFCAVFYFVGGGPECDVIQCG